MTRQASATYENNAVTLLNTVILSIYVFKTYFLTLPAKFLPIFFCPESSYQGGQLIDSMIKIKL